MARCLEGLGHEVIVADPNFAPMYATRARKVKSDRRDARALADQATKIADRGYIIVHGKIEFEGRSTQENELVTKYYPDV